MAARLTSDTSFWLKFVRDSSLSANNSTVLQYAMVLADRFNTVEDLLAADEDELNQLGISNQAERILLIKQARLLANQTDLSSTVKKRTATASRVIETWLGDSEAKPLSTKILSKSTCNLSPALLSRISFNERPASVIYPYDEPSNVIRKRNFGHLTEKHEKIITVDDNGKLRTSTETGTPILEYQGVLKKAPSSTTNQGMRTLKVLSETISLKKKVVFGSDRLKRLDVNSPLDSSSSLLQRQTSFLTKKVTSIANKLVNPFAPIRKKIDSSEKSILAEDQVDLRATMKRQCILVDNRSVMSSSSPRRTVTVSSAKQEHENDDDDELKGQRRVQVLCNKRPPADLFSYQNQDEEEEEEKVATPTRTVMPVATIANKRFKLGATTSFLTRSLANHGLIE